MTPVGQKRARYDESRFISSCPNPNPNPNPDPNPNPNQVLREPLLRALTLTPTLTRYDESRYFVPAVGMRVDGSVDEAHLPHPHPNPNPKLEP